MSAYTWTDKNGVFHAGDDPPPLTAGVVIIKGRFNAHGRMISQAVDQAAAKAQRDQDDANDQGEADRRKTAIDKAKQDCQGQVDKGDGMIKQADHDADIAKIRSDGASDAAYHAEQGLDYHLDAANVLRQAGDHMQDVIQVAGVRAPGLSGFLVSIGNEAARGELTPGGAALSGSGKVAEAAEEAVAEAAHAGEAVSRLTSIAARFATPLKAIEYAHSAEALLKPAELYEVFDNASIEELEAFKGEIDKMDPSLFEKMFVDKQDLKDHVDSVIKYKKAEEEKKEDYKKAMEKAGETPSQAGADEGLCVWLRSSALLRGEP